ncbi:MAG: LCP family protein [Actinomycetota bacterium]
MNRRSRTWRQRLAIGGLSLLTLLLLLSAAAVGYVANVLSRIDRVDVALDPVEVPVEVDIDGDGEPDQVIIGDSEEQELGPAGPPRNFLIVGSDDVSGVAADDAILSGRDDEIGQSLADTIMLLRVEPADGSAQLLSIPRDLWVEIVDDDGNFFGKVNGAFNLEDEDERADRLTATVREALDVPINHYVHVNWDGFRDLVDIVGGVDVCFEQPQRDLETGFLVDAAGVEELDGDEALAYVRSRRMQGQDDDGVWRSLGVNSDLERIDRQQDFLRLVIDQTGDLRGLGNVRQLQQLVDSALANVEIDGSLALGDVFDLVRRYGAFGGDDLETYSLEVVDVRRGELDTLDLVDSATNQTVLDLFRGIAPPPPSTTVPPSTTAAPAATAPPTTAAPTTTTEPPSSICPPS